MKKLVFLILFLIPGILFAQGSSFIRNDAHALAVPGRNGDRSYASVDGYGQQYVITGASAIAATFAAVDATGFAGIGAAYASAVILVAAKVVILDNQTNGDVMVSMDAGATDTFHVKAGDVISLNLSASGLISSADIQLKDGTAASTAGTFYVSSYK